MRPPRERGTSALAFSVCEGPRHRAEGQDGFVSRLLPGSGLRVAHVLASTSTAGKSVFATPGRSPAPLGASRFRR